jgi:putative inorganic carbon (hco3(-)) transporter
MSDVLGVVGMLIACGAAAAAILAPRARWQPVAVGVALVAAPLLVLGDVWDDSQVVEARDSPALIAAAVVGLVAAVAVVAAILRRFEWALPALVFGALALRVPLQIGGETSNLLVPLYLVIASAFVAGLGRERTLAAGAEAPAVVWLRRALAATLVLYAVQSIYSEDFSNAVENAGFFLVPFAILFTQLTEVRWDRNNLTAATVAIGVVGAGVALIALGQFAARDLFLNDELLDSNQLKPAFRVNSVFFDPNVLGRYLALGVIALGAAVAWSRGGWQAALATAIGVLMLAGLALSFSITSVAALLAGMGVLAVLRYGLRGGLLAGAAVLLTAAVFAATGGADRSDLGPTRGLDEETSGRSALLEGGFDLIEEEPIIGWGSGAFGRAFFDEVRETKTTASHSEPINVAAEQGIPGVLVYAGLLVAMLWTLLGSGVTSSPGRAAAAAAAVALMVHSLGYASFLTDPATWAVLGVAVGLRRLEG